MSGAEERVQRATLNLLRQSVVDGRGMETPATFPYEIAPGLHWLGGCLRNTTPSGGAVHTGVWSFLIVGTERTLLYDTGSAMAWESLAAQVEQALDGRTLDYVVPSHPEFPHSGNLSSLMGRYPGSLGVGDMRDYHLHYPERAHRFESYGVGDELDLGGGYAFRFVDAVLRDMPSTIWGYEPFNRALFVADGFASLHRPGGETHTPDECGRISRVGDVFPTLEDILHYSSAAFYWSRFRADSGVAFDRLEALLEQCPTEILAPSHGLVTVDLDRVVPLGREAHAKAFRGAG
jgi:flavorubredoxin